MHTGIILPVSPVDPLSRYLYILKLLREGPDGKLWTISLFRFICKVGQDCRLRFWGERACVAVELAGERQQTHRIIFVEDLPLVV